MNKQFIKKTGVFILAFVLLVSQAGHASVLMGNGIGNQTLTAQAATVPSKIKLNKNNLTLNVGKSQKLKATVTPASAKTKVTWTSSNKKVATVASDGTVKAVKAGTAIITAKTSNNIKAVCKITVKKPVVAVASVKLKEKDITIDINELWQLTAVISPNNATDKTLSWFSDDEDTVYVDDDGMLYPMEVGTARITVNSMNGKEDYVDITVIDAEALAEDEMADEEFEEEFTEDWYIFQEENEEEYVPTATPTVKPTEKPTEKSVEIPVRKTLEEGTYQIALSSTKYVFDVVDGANKNGTKVIVYESHGGNNQKWTLKNAGNNKVYFLPLNATDKVLDVMRTNNSVNGALKAGCLADIYQQNDKPAQEFYLDQFTDGTYVIRLASDEKLVLQADTKGRSDVKLADYDVNNRLQRWDIGKISASGTSNAETPVRKTLEEGTYQIALSSTKYVFDVFGASNKNGAKIIVCESHGGNNQKWTLKNAGSNKVYFSSLNATDKVLDVMRTNNSVNGALKAGCSADIYQQNDKPAQEFYLDQFADGTYVIRLTSDEKLVLQADAKGQSDVKLADYDVNNRLQRWDISKLAASQGFDFNQRLQELKSKFPHGAYWNHAANVGNNPDGYTTTPCSDHSLDNEFSKAWQCHGFALKLGYDVFGTDPRTWNKVYNLNNLHVGDIIRYNNDKHTIFVTGISGNTITYADCNSDYRCKIRWDATISIQNISGLTYVLTKY